MSNSVPSKGRLRMLPERPKTARSPGMMPAAQPAHPLTRILNVEATPKPPCCDQDDVAMLFWKIAIVMPKRILTDNSSM